MLWIFKFFNQNKSFTFAQNFLILLRGGDDKLKTNTDMKKLMCFIGTMAIMFLMVGQLQAVEYIQGKTAEQQQKIEGPEIQFDKLVHDYGNIMQGDNGDCTFEFTNIGTEPLILSQVRSSCGCTVPTWPKEPIMPGKKASIKVHYDTYRVGSISKSITVTTNGLTDRVVLRIAGTVSPKAN